MYNMLIKRFTYEAVHRSSNYIEFNSVLSLQNSQVAQKSYGYLDTLLVDNLTPFYCKSKD